MVILVVDSNKKALDQEAEHLARRHSAVMVSFHSNGNDALRFAMNHDADYLFTRRTLEDMSGEELIKRIKKYKPDIKCEILGDDESIPIFSKETQTSMLNQNKKETKPRRFSILGHHKNKTETAKGESNMIERDLHSLSRKELLEIMIEQGKEMESNKEKYRKDLDFLKTQYEKELDAMKAEYDKELADLKEKYDGEANTESCADEALKSENEKLKAELLKTKKIQSSYDINIDEAGSIAEAALKINGVFETAEAASRQYLDNIKQLSERQKSICELRESESKAKAEHLIQETMEKCAEMEAECKKKCEFMEQQAERRSQAYWKEVSAQLEEFYEKHQELKKLLSINTQNYLD